MSPEKVHAIVFDNVPGPALTNVEPAEFMGSRFIKGRSVGPSDDHWVHNRIGYVAMDKIRSIVIFDSITDYREAMRRHRTRQFNFAKQNPPPP